MILSVQEKQLLLEAVEHFIDRCGADIETQELETLCELTDKLNETLPT